MHDTGKIYIAGSRGFLGTHLKELLLENGYDVFTENSKLLHKPAHCLDFIKFICPNTVINLAGVVGGIGKNKHFPATMFYQNLMISTNLLHASYMGGVKKYVGMTCGCAYPDGIMVPMREEILWEGLPEENVTPFAIAKKSNIIMAQAYRKQHSFNAVSIIGGNAYGEHDYFDAEHAHVIPSIMLKVRKAMADNSHTLQLWGSGEPVRDFIYAKDMAEGIMRVMLDYDKPEPLNVASGDDITIRRLAELICDIAGFEGIIDWDTSKPEGQKVKTFSTYNMEKELNWKPTTSLKEGLKNTWEWYCENISVD